MLEIAVLQVEVADMSQGGTNRLFPYRFETIGNASAGAVSRTGYQQIA